MWGVVGAAICVIMMWGQGKFRKGKIEERPQEKERKINLVNNFPPGGDLFMSD
ncbi:MAG: hypothetical protein ACYTBJ_14640 [Planctomycetota bacterium]|jgi:hypothetical protein